MPSPVLLPDRSKQQQVHGLPHVCRSAFYGVREDVTLETGDSKPTRVSLSFPTRAKTWPKVWCTSHGRRAGHDGARHALFAALRFGRALHFGSRARACRLLERPTFAQLESRSAGLMCQRTPTEFSLELPALLGAVTKSCSPTTALSSK